MGDKGAEGSSATGDGGQAAISLTPDVVGTGFGSLLNSIRSTLLKKKTIQRCPGSSSFFLIINNTGALYCILNGCCNLCVLLYVGSCAAKANHASSNKENPFSISCNVNLFGSSITSSSCLFVLSLDRQFLGLLSCTSCSTASFLLASRHSGLEIKTYSILYCTVKYTTICRGCVYMTMYARHVN